MARLWLRSTEDYAWRDNIFLRFPGRWIVSLRRPVQVMNCICVALQSLLLASCAFPTLLVNIYIVSFTMNATDATDGFSRLEIRVGYFYQCFRTDGGAHWVCGDYDRLERHLGGVTEPWNLRKTAYDLRARAVSPVFLIISMVPTLALIHTISLFPIPRVIDEDETAARFNRWILQSLLWSTALSTLSSFLAALWQHTVASTAAPLVAYLSSGEVVAAVGPAATTLAWLNFLLLLIAGSICFRARVLMIYQPMEGTITTSSFASATSIPAGGGTDTDSATGGLGDEETPAEQSHAQDADARSSLIEMASLRADGRGVAT